MTVSHLRRQNPRTIGFLILLVLVACRQQEVDRRKPTTAVPVQEVATTDRIQAIRVTGEIRARVESALSFRVAGRITERNVDVGAHVTADKVLAKVEPTEQQANVAAATAGVAAAEARLQQVSAAFDRQKALMARGYTTRRDYDQAEESFRTAEGSLDAAKAQLGQAQDQLAQTELRAGVSGIVTARNAEIGQVVQVAQPVFSIAHDGPRDAVFNVPESLLLHDSPDKSVRVVLVADPSVRIAGPVREVSPTVDPASGTVQVKIDVDRPPQEMSLRAPVIAEARIISRDVILLPWSALTSSSGNPAVWVVDRRTTTVSLRSVAVVDYDTGTMVLRDGLTPGELVVVAGAQLLRNGQVVSIAAEAGR